MITFLLIQKNKYDLEKTKKRVFSFRIDIRHDIRKIIYLFAIDFNEQLMQIFYKFGEGGVIVNNGTDRKRFNKHAYHLL
ncbi:hypothetical protein D3C71_1576910 [compost metagenome]